MLASNRSLSMLLLAASILIGCALHGCKSFLARTNGRLIRWTPITLDLKKQQGESARVRFFCMHYRSLKITKPSPRNLSTSAKQHSADFTKHLYGLCDYILIVALTIMISKCIHVYVERRVVLTITASLFGARLLLSAMGRTNLREPLLCER